jgi:hypothetical protein
VDGDCISMVFVVDLWACLKCKVVPENCNIKKPVAAPCTRPILRCSFWLEDGEIHEPLYFEQ